ncbi:MAG: hypothetical protein ACJ798_06845 [Phenylobacterium sp.]
MRRFDLHALAAIAAAGAFGAAQPSLAQPDDTVFVAPGAAPALATGASALAPPPPTPTADDLRSLAQARSGGFAGGQMAGAFTVGTATPAIPHGQIPGVASGAVFGSGGQVLSAGTLGAGSAIGGTSFGVGLSTTLGSQVPVTGGLGVATLPAGPPMAPPPPPPS